MENDEVDELVLAWRRERADLDLAPVEVFSRISRLSRLLDRARRALGHRLDRAQDDVAHQRARARSLSPLATLERGYAVLEDADGHVVTSVAGVAVKSAISVRVADGRVHALTTGTTPTTTPTTTSAQPLEENDG